MVQQRKWSELSPARRRMICVAAAGQLTLLAAALLDLRRRPADQVRGPKRMWVGLAFVNYVGPLAYFLFGRKH